MAEIDFANLRVLVIDDETFTRQILERTLNELEIGSVTLAIDGLDGLTIFSNARNNFDLVICDLKMPMMDGFEFVRRLREKKYLPNANVPILIVTGHSDEDSIQSAVKAGIHGYLVKPVSKKQLEKRIVSVLTSPQIDPEMFK